MTNILTVCAVLLGCFGLLMAFLRFDKSLQEAYQRDRREQCPACRAGLVILMRTPEDEHERQEQVFTLCPDHILQYDRIQNLEHWHRRHGGLL